MVNLLVYIVAVLKYKLQYVCTYLTVLHSWTRVMETVPETVLLGPVQILNYVRYSTKASR